MVYVGNKRFVLKISLKKILDQLPSDIFQQIHRAYIVAINQIDDIDISNNELAVGQEKLPIGRSYRDGLLSNITIVK